MTAPSGFGKTALLADFVTELEEPVSWLTLDRWDTDPRELLASLAGAIAPQGQTDTSAGNTLDDLRRQLRMAVWSARGDQLRVIVLDDYQSIEGSPGVSLIEELLESASGHLHIIIASRGLPRLEGLARLVAQGSALCLGIDDLCFDQDEVKRFFAEIRGVDISEPRVAEVLQRTDGWPAHISLLTVTRDSSIESIGNVDLFLDDLLTETFERQSSAVRRFLLSTSILPVLEPEFCDELIVRTNSQKILKELERGNVFLKRVEGEATAYRLHQPFRKCLKERLRAEKAATFVGLCTRAGRLSEARGNWDDAISLYTDAQLWPEVIRALREAAETLLAYGRAERVQEWLRSLPRDSLWQNLDLVLLRARVHLDLGELDEALQDISRLLQQADCPDLLKSRAILYRSVCLSRKGQHREAIQMGRTAVSLLKGLKATPELEAEAYLRLGTAIGTSGQFARAVPSLRRAVALAESLGDVRTTSIGADGLADAFVNLGRIAEAQWYFEKARQGWASLGNEYRLALTLNNLGVMYSWQGEYEVSSQLLLEAIERSRATGNARIEAFGMLSLGDVKRDTGGYQEALDLYSEGLAKARRLGEAYFVDYAVDALGTTYMLMGDLTKAEVLIRHAAAEVGERSGSYQTGLLSLSQGILGHLRGEFSESALLLQTAVRLLHDAGAARDEARAHFHLAHVFLATNSRRRAHASLQEVARLVNEIGYSAFLAADARRCPALIGFASSKRIGDGLFARLREDDVRRLARSGKTASDLGLGPTYPPVEAFGLGQATVRIGGRLITDSDWSSLKSKEMFFLFLSRKEPLSRDECCAALWPESDQARTTSNFHSTLYRLRSATYFDIVSNANGHYGLNPAAKFSFDVREFEDLVRQGDARPAGDPARNQAFESAAALYGGPFAREFYSEWAWNIQRRLEDKYLRVLGILASDAYVEHGYEKCLNSCDRILSVDETNDEAHCLKIESFMALGDRVSAVRHFESYRKLLEEEAAGPPSQRLSGVGRMIAASRS